MKKLITGCFLVSSLLLAIPPSVTSYTAPVVPKMPSTSDLITFYGAKYNISTKVLHRTIKCESNYKQFAVGDGGTSFGLSQIHLPAHPNITKAQAFDKEFAISYMANEMSKGRASQWTCWRMYAMM